jgi:uncharacterized membrane protein
MTDAAVPFRRGAVRPVECFRLGVESLTGHYGLFLGMTVVGVLIASYGPLGILMGPMYCGLFHCYLRRLAGEEVAFGQLFRGFDHFVESLLATIPILLASFLLSLFVVATVFVGVLCVVFGTAEATRLNTDAGPAFAIGATALVALWFLLLMALILIPLAILTTFTYPLIVDRGLPGFEALALGARSGLANAWGLAGLFLLNMALGLAGMCLCYVGALLVLPFSFAALAVAYRQVFPAAVASPLQGKLLK